MNTRKTKPYPDKVSLIEVGPRDGFQFEDRIIPTPMKVDIIKGLVDAGIRHIQVTSFVHPDRLPQMADADSLVRSLPSWDGVTVSGLVLNLKGVERAYRAGLNHIEVSISASNSHSKRNTGMTLRDASRHARQMIKFAKERGMIVRAGVQCAWGCFYEGEIPVSRVREMTLDFLEQNVDSVAFSDTTGMATPVSIHRLLSEILPDIEATPAIIHLHDTRGLGMVNLLAALEYGITHFDTALAGMGGCPFVPNAAGNIATEDTIYLLKSMNIDTGIDIRKVSECSLRLEKFLGKRFVGKIYRLSSNHSVSKDQFII
jgi:hydroxymethylglutaryl-CoA lyase